MPGPVRGEYGAKLRPGDPLRRGILKDKSAGQIGDRHTIVDSIQNGAEVLIVETGQIRHA
jgi:hypothetical protein